MILRGLFGQLSPTPSEPRIPEGMRIYAVGDIHGRADLLRHLGTLINADCQNKPVGEVQTVFLGDYVDRGAESKEVLELLSSRCFPTPIVPLCGNHEAMMLEFINSDERRRLWPQYGGLETLHSYGLNPAELSPISSIKEVAARFRAILPDAHLTFLRNLHLSFTVGDYFFCHAGIRPSIPLIQQRKEDLLWIREDFLKSTKWHGKVIVHGHTPVLSPEVAFNRINVDTGAYISGRLTCLVLEGASKRFLVADTAGARAESLLK
jgi:serine/threonine protein phosphatase 1